MVSRYVATSLASLPLLAVSRTGVISTLVIMIPAARAPPVAPAARAPPVAQVAQVAQVAAMAKATLAGVTAQKAALTMTLVTAAAITKGATNNHS